MTKEKHEIFDIKGRHELMDDLVSLLSWNSGEALVYEAWRAHLVWLHARLRIWDAASGIAISKRVKLLSQASQQRLLWAPQFTFVLATSNPADSAAVDNLLAFIEVEEMLARGSGSVSDKRWSAMGDICIAPDDAGESFYRFYEAPKAEQIVIDTRSPHQSEIPADWGVIQSLSDVETSELQRSVAGALALISHVAPTALSTIQASVRVILGITTPDIPLLTAGASTRRLTGRVLVTNAHTDVWEPARLADTLVHEAIHSVIYKLELAVPLFSDESAALSLNAVSPWSGRTLNLHSFVHACFVWYGLCRFWSLDTEGVGAFFHERARKGFAKRSPLDAIDKEGRKILHPYICSAMASMHANARSDC